MFNLFAKQSKLFKNLSGKEFKDSCFQAKGILLDVRTPGEFSSGTIKGAKNIDILSPLFNQAINKLDKDREYFVFCRSGGRSAQACNIMSKQGFKVHNLDGGIGQYPL